MFVSFLRPWQLLPLEIDPKLMVSKDYLNFLAFNWLISACLIKSAAFIKDLHLSTMFYFTWFTPVLGVATANIEVGTL